MSHIPVEQKGASNLIASSCSVTALHSSPINTQLFGRSGQTVLLIIIRCARYR